MRPERGADNPAVLDVPNVKVKFESQHPIPTESSLLVTGKFYLQYYYYYYYYYSVVKKSNFFLSHAMKAYRYSSIHSEPWYWMETYFSPQLLYPQERTPVPTEQKADWVPEPIWTFCRTEKSLAPIKIQTPGLPSHSPVAVPTTLLRLDVMLLTLHILKGKAVPL